MTKKITDFLCEFCNKPLTVEDIKTEVGSHYECWCEWVTKERAKNETKNIIK